MRTFLCVSALVGAAFCCTASPADDAPAAPKVAARKHIHEYDLPKVQLAQSAHFSLDGTHVVVLAILAEDFFAKGLAHVYEVKTDQLVRTITNPTRVVGLAFADGGKKLVLSGWEDDFRVYGGDKWEQIAAFPNDPKRVSVKGLIAHPDGKQFLSDNHGFAGPRLWNLDTKTAIRFPPSEGLTDSALSPDGKVVARGFLGRIELYEAATAKLTAKFDTGDGLTACLRFSPDGKVLAAGFLTGEEKKQLWLWDVATRKVLHVCEGMFAVPNNIVFTPDGKYVLTYLPTFGEKDGRVYVWSVATGKLVESFDPGGPGSQLALSPDGTVLVTVSDDGRARKWDFATIRKDFEARK